MASRNTRSSPRITPHHALEAGFHVSRDLKAVLAFTLSCVPLGHAEYTLIASHHPSPWRKAGFHVLHDLTAVLAFPLGCVPLGQAEYKLTTTPPVQFPQTAHSVWLHRIRTYRPARPGSLPPGSRSPYRPGCREVGIAYNFVKAKRTFIPFAKGITFIYFFTLWICPRCMLAY